MNQAGLTEIYAKLRLSQLTIDTRYFVRMAIHELTLSMDYLSIRLVAQNYRPSEMY